MDKIQPFSRMINGYEIVPYTGGCKFRNGDTLMARITPCLENGKTAFVSILDSEEVGFGSTEYIVLRGKKDISDNLFVYYFCTNQAFRDIAIKSMVGSSGRQRVQQNVLENLEVQLPSLTEQQKIASILSSLDDKIELNNRINANLEQQAQAIFKSWFVDFEPFKDGEFVDSEMGRIPKGWKVDVIGNVTNVIRGASPRPIQEYLSDEGMPWVKISDATESRSKYLVKTNQYIKKEGISKSRRVGPDTLILSNSATPGLPMIMSISACVHDGWLIFDEYKGITKEYLYYFLLIERDKIVSLSNGSVFRNLKTDILKSYKMVIPPDEIMQEATSLYKDINASILNNMNEIMALAHLRNSLLPKLMSGEIEV